MKWQTLDTKKGTRCRVLEGGSGAPVVFFHGAAGLLADNPFLERLAQPYHVVPPEWPGYGEAPRAKPPPGMPRLAPPGRGPVGPPAPGAPPPGRPSEGRL